MTNYQYQIGGTLESNHCSYVKRKADDDLYNYLKNGDFCYVFNTRQMGKSSLQAQVQAKLIEDGFTCVYITLEDIGTNITEEKWYYSLIDLLVFNLDLDDKFDLENWWNQNHNLTDNIRKFSKFIEEILLKLTEEKIIIFIDEIDAILSLDFKMNNFFSVLRACYNKRANNPDYQRLTFCLIGVATPNDLIQDTGRSPFNIGQAIELNYFTFNEAKILTEGFKDQVKNPDQILEIILKWTGGQPFLTQILCNLVSQLDQNINNPENAENFISDLVQTKILANWKYDDPQSHFCTIERRLLNSKNSKQLLKLYNRICNNKTVKANQNNSESNQLLLTGLIRKENNNLIVINPIYQTIFNPYWVERELIKLGVIPSIKKIIPINLITSLLTTTVILGLRSLGLFQSWELQSYDLMMRFRPDQGKDERLLVIEITEEDLVYQDNKGMQRQGSLSDQALDKILDKLEPLQPQAIGLNIIRSFPVNSNYPQLLQRFKHQENFFAVCVGDEPENNRIGIKPPPEIPNERLGFSDILPDQDGIIRRYLWYANFGENSPCQVRMAFSFQLALFYLQSQNIEPEVTPESYVKLGKVTLKRLNNPAGGYQQFDNGGYQMLLNYRTKHNIAETLTLRDILEDNFDPNLIKNRIVLIGVTAHSIRKTYYTPFGKNINQEMTGVMLHGQMISQILSAVLDGKTLLSPTPQWIDIIWVFGWGMVAGFVIWRWESFSLIVINGVIIILLSGVCYLLFIQGWWIAFIPSLLTFVITGLCLTIYKVSFYNF
jgi:CHASE2 domain-containing sensor protein